MRSIWKKNARVSIEKIEFSLDERNRWIANNDRLLSMLRDSSSLVVVVQRLLHRCGAECARFRCQVSRYRRYLARISHTASSETHSVLVGHLKRRVAIQLRGITTKLYVAGLYLDADLENENLN